MKTIETMYKNYYNHKIFVALRNQKSGWNLGRFEIYRNHDRIHNLYNVA